MGFLSRLFICLILILGIYGNTFAQENDDRKRIAILVSDNFSKPISDAIQSLNKNPEFAKRYKIIGAKADIREINQASVVVCYVHTPQVIQIYTNNLQQIIQKGGFVYGIGGTPEEDNYKKWGMRFDPIIAQYFDNPSIENIKRMIFLLADRHLQGSFKAEKPDIYTENGLYNWKNGRVYNDYDAFYESFQKDIGNAPWVGIYGFRHEFLSGQDQYIKDYASALTIAGFNVMCFFGHPLENTLENFCFDSNGKSRIEALMSFSSIPGGVPERINAMFIKLGIPVINCISTSKSLQDWKKDLVGLSIAERSFALVRPEIMGQIQPTIVATSEEHANALGYHYKLKVSIPSRIKNVVEKIKGWVRLRTINNNQKQIALIYFNGHPGKHNIGASYLNVLPRSLHSMVKALEKDGYNLGNDSINENKIFEDVMAGGRNIGTYAPAELDRIVKENNPTLISMSQYNEWFSKLSPKLQKQVIDKWDIADSSKIMTWSNQEGKKFFVIPNVKYGNVHLMPQPIRGWDEDAATLFHDVNLPPHHQYIAFYLYLQNEFKANAIVHVGTHGTVEWLSGREAGLDEDDAPDALLGSMVHIYPYIMDNVGEGTQAKRRGGAVIIDHLTPPFQEAGLRPELKELAGAINDYVIAAEKSPVLADAHLVAINRWAKKANILRDLNIEDDVKAEHVHDLEHYLQELNEHQTPMGMHTFGKSPDENAARLTAKAMVSRQKGLTQEEQEKLLEEYINRIVSSGPAEIQAFLDALSGKYITASTGNDPLRNPDAMPTGKNFYAFDPMRMPAKDTYEVGAKLAEELIVAYQKKHNGKFPDKIAFNLWSVESIRHEGIMESQMLRLMGVRPKYDALGRIKGIEVISRDSLARPRIDVVATPSGLYRDMFPNIVNMLDQAVTMVANMDEPDNHIREHIESTKKELFAMGVKDSSLVARLASVRLFGTATGSYGIGLDDAIQATDKWEDDKQITSVYFNRSSHLYGQGFWGSDLSDVNKATGKDLAVSLFQKALSGTKTVVHSRSTNLYGVLDNDDFFQYLGGMAMAIKSIDGTEPDIMVSNLTDPSKIKQETINQVIGRELNTRYLNPEWINKMMAEGYAGARMVGDITSNMWGWQVTTENAITSTDWQEWHDVYVNDKYDLDIKNKFKEAKNVGAYQNMIAKMLEAVRKDYWKADEKTINEMVTAYLETTEGDGLSCSDQVCSNEKLLSFIEKNASSVSTQQQIKNLHSQLGQIHSASYQDTPKTDFVEPANDAKPTQTLSKNQSSPTSTQNNTNPEQITATQNIAQAAPDVKNIKGYKMEEEKIFKLGETSKKPNSEKSISVLAILLIIFSWGYLIRVEKT